MDQLFPTDDMKVIKCCQTCGHATERHGRIRKQTYPLVCLLKACAVPYVCGEGHSRMVNYPCGYTFDADGIMPRGWIPK